MPSHRQSVSVCKYFPAKHYWLIKHSSFLKKILHSCACPISWATCAHFRYLYLGVFSQREGCCWVSNSEGLWQSAHTGPCWAQLGCSCVRRAAALERVVVSWQNQARQIFSFKSVQLKVFPFALTCYTFCYPDGFPDQFCASLLWLMYLEDGEVPCFTLPKTSAFIPIYVSQVMQFSKIRSLVIDLLTDVWHHCLNERKIRKRVWGSSCFTSRFLLLVNSLKTLKVNSNLNFW